MCRELFWIPKSAATSFGSPAVWVAGEVRGEFREVGRPSTRPPWSARLRRGARPDPGLGAWVAVCPGRASRARSADPASGRRPARRPPGTWHVRRQRREVFGRGRRRFDVGPVRARQDRVRVTRAASRFGQLLTIAPAWSVPVGLPSASTADRDRHVTFTSRVVEQLAKRRCLVACQPVGADDSPTGSRGSPSGVSVSVVARGSRGSDKRTTSPYDVRPGARSISSSNAGAWDRTASPSSSPTVLMHNVGTHASFQSLTRDARTLSQRTRRSRPSGGQIW